MFFYIMIFLSSPSDKGASVSMDSPAELDGLDGIIGETSQPEDDGWDEFQESTSDVESQPLSKFTAQFFVIRQSQY